GTLDMGFQVGLPGVCCSYVESIALQSDGKVLVGGDGGITRLNLDGTLDSGFQSRLSGAGGFQAYVNSVAVQIDGKVLIGGYFSTVNGVSCSNTALLYRYGSLCSTFRNGS